MLLRLLSIFIFGFFNNVLQLTCPSENGKRMLADRFSALYGTIAVYLEGGAANGFGLSFNMITNDLSKKTDWS